MAQKSNFIVRGGMDYSDITKGMKTVQSKMGSFQKTIGNSMKLVAAAFVGIGIKNLVKDSLTAASSLESAMMGLESIVTGQGRDINRAKGFINDYVKDGLVPLTNAVTAYKNLTARGYNDDQIELTMNRLKDAASFGRQASYSLGDAVQSATEGLKNENSILVDNAGVTKNVSKMWEDYASSIGKTSNSLSKQEKIQAEVNGIMTETQFQVGDASKYTSTYSGRLASLNKTILDIKVNLGNAFMPIANVVIPLLQSLGNKLASITSTIAVFTQALFGKAIVSATTNTESQAEAIGAMGDATEKAGKQAQKALAPIDEITKIGSGSSGSVSSSDGGSTSTGGTSTSTTEEVSNTNGMAVAAEKLKEILKPTIDALKNLWTAVQPLAGAIGAGFMIFIDALVGIGKEALSNWIPAGINGIAKALKLISPDTATALGGALGGLAAAFLLYKGMTTIASIVLGIKTSFGTLLSTLGKHPILVIAGAVAALAGAVLALDKAKFDASSIGKYVKKIEELTDNSKAFNDEVKTMLKDHDERQSDIKAEYGAVEILADKYFDLADKQTLTNDQQLLLKTYADELIKKVPELSGLIDEQTGAYKGTKGEIEALITKTKEYYLVQAAQESLIEIAKKQYEAEKLLKDLATSRADASNKLTEAQNALNTAVKESSVYGESSATTARKVYEAHQEYDRTINELEKSIVSIDGEISNTTQTQKNLSKEWDYASDYITTYSTDAKTAMDKVEKAVNTALTNIETKVKNFKLPTMEVKIGVNTTALEQFKAGTKYAGINATEYATGGLPSAGELFVAREAGPELVGRIGSNSAVANNDQIVEAVSIGVANAVSAVMGGQRNSQGGDVIIMVGEEEIARAVNRGQASLNGRYNPVLVGG